MVRLVACVLYECEFVMYGESLAMCTYVWTSFWCVLLYCVVVLAYKKLVCERVAWVHAYVKAGAGDVLVCV